MSMVRWNPRTDLASFSRDPFFNHFFDVLGEAWNHEPTWLPRLDLVEEKDQLVARVELPGLDPKDVQIHLQGDVLTIQGERRQETESEGRVLSRESTFGSFTRTVQLPYRVQADKVKAQYKNGVMSVFLPKAEEFVGRQIPVEIAK